MDLSNYKIQAPKQQQKTSIIKAVSWLWIMSGIIVFIIGLWSGVLYMIFEPYRAKLVAVGDGHVFERFMTAITYLPWAAAFFIVLASANFYVGMNFKKFKNWALKAVEYMSYLMMVVSAFIFYGWLKIWLFSAENMPAAQSGGWWQYVGLFTGLIACVFYVMILFFIVRTIRSQEFIKAYHSKIIV
jgi:hypothetical protein